MIKTIIHINEMFYYQNEQTVATNLNENKPFAVIYPLPLNIASRILNDKKSIFAKYLTHETISPKLTSCKKLLLYISGANKEIAGEAEIKYITLMTLSEVILEHSKDLFLKEDELLEYSNGRDSKKMIVFKLGEIKPYLKHKALGHGITMIGEYISEEEYSALLGNFDMTLQS